jgi:hypothetical protein
MEGSATNPGPGGAVGDGRGGGYGRCGRAIAAAVE